MKSLLIILTTLVLTCSIGQAQTREERVKKLPYRLLSVPKKVKSRLLKDVASIRLRLNLNNFGNWMWQKAFIKVASDNITAIPLDTTKSIKGNRQALNFYWSSHNLHSTYFAFNGYSTNAITNKSSGKFVIIEIEDEELTGTVSIFYPVKKVNGKWKFTKDTPEFEYYERS